MAQNKPSVFRFRLPWLLQPALAPQPTTAPEPPRTTAVQTSVASASAPKPPFRPPGRARPPSVTTPRAPSVSVAPPPSPTPPPPPPPPPQPPTEPKSPPKSPNFKTIDPVSTQTTKETKTTTTTTAPAVLVASPPSPPPPQPPIEPKSPAPKSPNPKTIDPVSTQTTKETQTTTTTTAQETPSPPTPPKRPQSFRPPSPPQPSSPTKSNSQPSSPSRSPPVSPSRANTKPLSPSRLATKTRAISQPTSPVNVKPPSPPPSPQPQPPPPTITTTTVQQTSKPTDTPEPKKSPEITHEKFPVDSYHVPQADHDHLATEMTKLKEAQTKSMKTHTMEAKSPKQKQKTTAAQVPLHREIRDDISKIIHKMATSSGKQSMDEKHASVITLAGDNKGAFMHLHSDTHKREGAIDIQRGYKLDDATNNGEGSSKGKKPDTDSKGGEDEEMKAVVNSNVQGINNSIMFNSSVTERNPGVHLAFSRTLEKSDSKIESSREDMEMYKAEADISPLETLVYDPTTGRSGGAVFLEPSDCEGDDDDDLEMFGGEYEIEVL